MGEVFSRCVSDVQVSDTGNKNDIDPLSFLQNNKATALSGWKEIYEHLARKCETSDGGDDIRPLQMRL